MFTAAAGSVAPETRKGRTATVRPSTIFHSSNSNDDITAALRLQRLKLFGIIGQRAEMIAGMVWEVRHG